MKMPFHFSNHRCDPRRWAAVVVCLLLAVWPTMGGSMSPAVSDDYTVTLLPGNDKLPYNALKCLRQDRLGFLWMGTENGLYRYDGFHLKRYASNLLRPDYLTSNNISCLCDDGASTLWIGTDQGITALDMRLGLCRHYHLRDFDNADVVSTLFRSREGDLWAGTQGGLYRYDARQDRFVLYCNQRGNAKVPHCSVTSICEDSHGFLWVGTWDHGLYRLHRRSGQWYEMPRFNDSNSAQQLYSDDRHGRLFVGTWGRGVYVILNPHDTGKPLRFKAFTHDGTGGVLASDYIWNISATAKDRRVWIGSSKGLCYEQDGRLWPLPQEKMPQPEFFSHGAGGLLPTDGNALWVYGSGRGIAAITQPRRRFTTINIPEPYRYDDYIVGMAFDPDGRLWAGLHDGGIIHQTADGSWAHIDAQSQVYGFNFRDDGTVLAGTEYNGILIIRDGKVVGHCDTANSPWLRDNCVYCFYPTAEGSLLIGTWKGLSLIDPHGHGSYLSTPRLKALAAMRVREVTRDADGSYWLATHNKGIARLSGRLPSPQTLRLKVYDTVAGTSFQFKDVDKVLRDAQGNVWVCCHEAGLLRYDAQKDAFVSMNKALSIADEEVYSIEETHDGRLWVATRNNLIAFRTAPGGTISDPRFYARTEVMGAEMFGHGRSAVSMDGRLCFAGSGRFSIFTGHIPPSGHGRQSAFVSDIRIFGTSLSEMDSTQLADITPLLPPYTDRITLTHDQRDVTLEMAAITHGVTDGVRYAYMLEGYDKDWHYANGDVHQVNYNNLPTGTYTFLLRATDDNGAWSGSPRRLTIRVLPPWYFTWWAIVVYLLLLAGAVWLVVRHYKNRERIRREVQLAHMESKNIEELNHKKLQFFTNITHDLMTPLTVISATVGTLRESHPDDSKPYRVIEANVNRLMRLLQQILEFRKTETGNLRLRVAKGDLTDFTRREVESILPLAKSRHLSLQFHTDAKPIVGYFDSDAVDKILYNLISNAAKYNHEGGAIDVSLHSDDGLTAVFTVSDTGAGIAADKLPHLFSRFYEGEHRRFNTYGTGIGLSLVKDLTEAHHGQVAVVSQVGQGSRFTVTLPIYKEAFRPTEIDDTTELLTQADSTTTEEDGTGSDDKTKKAFTVLLVEDNEDLVEMLTKLLSHHYRVLTAYNGQEALDTLQSHKADIIVTDIMMPVMDGVELTRRLRQDPRLAQTPVIMLTAKRDDEDRAEAYRVGADAYITKPFNTSVLLARISNLLEHRQKADREVIDKVLGGLRDVKLSVSDEEFVNQCIAVVQKHIADVSFDQPLFALEMGMSKSSLYKKLRATTGQSTSGFIRTVRMQAAARLLRQDPKAHIADVAYAVGYNDPKYFSACFKKDFGCLPSEYAAQKAEGKKDD